VLLLKSDMLADSIYSTPCMTARPAVEYISAKSVDCYKISDTGHEHPGIVADGRRAL